VTVRGKNRQARPFLSCSAFPKCRTAKDLPPELKEQGEKALVRWRDLEARNRADAETYRRSPAGLEDGEGRLAGGASPSRE
jgi:ssDNA-binding Zn-finger/Zn-ribbon topoisomerase 1